MTRSGGEMGHVLVARLDNAGDVLLAGPALRAVASGAGRVSLLCSPAGRAAAELLPGVDEVVVFDAPWVSFDAPPAERRAVDALVDRVADLHLDAAAVLTSFHQSPLPLALLLRLAGVARIASVSVDYPGSLLDVRLPYRDDVHEVERNLSVVAALGFRLPPGDDGSLAVRALPAEGRPFDRPYVVVHPGASVAARAIDLQRAARLVEMLVDDGWFVAVTGSASESEACASTAGCTRPSVLDMAGTTDLAGLAAVVAGASAIVTGNTGPAHLAAAVGTPVVSVFAPVVPARQWRPWQIPAVLLGDQDIACAGCRARTCPFLGQPCTAAVTAEAMAAAVHRLAPRPLLVP